PPPPRSRKPGRRHRQARAARPKYNRGADQVSVPYPRDERSRRTIPSLLQRPRVYAIPRKPAVRAAFSRLRMSARAVTAEPWDEAIGSKVFQNECGGVSPPDLQLREDHAARRGSDRAWLHGEAHAGQPALRPRPRPVQEGAR